MIATFLDTTFFLGLVLDDDELHRRATAWHRAIRGSFLTTEFVMIEVADALAHPNVRDIATALFEMVYNDFLFTVVRAESQLVDDGFKLFQERTDKKWSLTDCISFNVMTERGITDALTHGHHFEQACFRALLREDPPSN